MVLHEPIPPPSCHMAQTNLRLSGQICCLSHTIFVHIYLSKISTHVVLNVIKLDNATQELTGAWYLQQNMNIGQSLAYALEAPISSLRSTGLYVSTNYGGDPIMTNEPLYDYNRFLDFDWNSYGIFDYVLHANIVVAA